MRTVEQMVKHFNEMQSHGTMATTSMLNEIEQQFISMAEGGDGGQLQGFEQGTTCRSHNYKGYPDSFFQAVCYKMGWKVKPVSNQHLYLAYHANGYDLLDPYSADPM